MTLAPLSTAKVMPRETLYHVPRLLPLSTLTGISLQDGQSPTMPAPLMAAVAMPATWVPWPKSSLGSSSLLTKS